MKTVLVMGLRGKTGRHVAKALARHKGLAVRGAARSAADLNVAGVMVSRFDWGDPASWPETVASVEAVYLVKPKTADPAGTVASFLRKARSIERLVLLSEIDAGNRGEAAEERKVEKVIESLPIAWTILRPNCSHRISLSHRSISKLFEMPVNSKYPRAVNRRVSSTLAILRTLRRPPSWIRVMQGDLTR